MYFITLLCQDSMSFIANEVTIVIYINIQFFAIHPGGGGGGGQE